MVIQTRVCKKHLWKNIPVLTQYKNWCIIPFKEEGRECAFYCKEEAQYQIQQEG